MVVDITTPHGPARAHLRPAPAARGALVLGHGAGGGVGARDLLAAAEAAGSVGLDRGARRAALPCRRPALAGTGTPARRSLGRGGRPPRPGWWRRSSWVVARPALVSRAAPRPGSGRTRSCASPSRSSRRRDRAASPPRAGSPSSTPSCSRPSSSRVSTTGSASRRRRRGARSPSCAATTRSGPTSGRSRTRCATWLSTLLDAR